MVRAVRNLAQLIVNVPNSIQSILDVQRGVLDPPIRSEIFGPQRFAEHGHSLGRTHVGAEVQSRTTNFFPRLDLNILRLRQSKQFIGERAASGYEISPAGEWLLDNFHLIEAQLKEIHEGLPKRYFSQLPILTDAPLLGLPRVYGIAWAFVAHTDGAFSSETLAGFLSAYEASCPLNLSEMWALPTTLRVVLIENLRRLAERVATNKAAREAANLCCDRMESYTLHALDQILVLMDERGVRAVFLTQLAQRLQDRQSTGAGGHHARYAAWLHNALSDLPAVLTQLNADEAADNLSMSNAITSLRSIGDADWTSIVSQTSTLMKLLLTSDEFRAEHVKTRDQTLHGIEALARKSRLSEMAVATSILHLIESADEPAQVCAAPSYWLRGAGRPRLLTQLGVKETFGDVWRRTRRWVTLPAYLAAILFSTCYLVLWLGRHYPVDGWASLWAFALMSVPASEAVVALINRLISESVRPQHLPRFAWPDGIPKSHRVLVVIPALLVNMASVRSLVHRLHLHYLSNPEPEAQFALLTDWTDADTVRTDTDRAMLDEVQRLLAALNARHPRASIDQDLRPRAPTFLVLHRERLFSDTEQKWIGWERKRGKLELLIATLSTGVNQDFLDLGELSRLEPHIQHILTLDSDTQMTPGCLRDLVSVAAHPLNQPRLDSTGKKLLGGYAILQPRTATPLCAQGTSTLYHWLFSGQAGIDPYSTNSSEVYQDLFGEGTFSGKGLLNVHAMHAVLADRLPEGRVLSHDLLEGAMTRCALVTDISVIEDSPFHADVASARLHRWTRGDWQLLPFLLQPNRYGLRPINIWKMCDNLRRTLVAPASFLLLVLAIAGWGLSPFAALALIFAAYAAGPLIGAAAGMWPSRYDVAKRHFYSQVGQDWIRALVGGVWALSQLAGQAWMYGDAIVRALFRLTVSHRHLLQWTTAESAQSLGHLPLVQIAKKHRHEPFIAVLTLAVLLIWRTPYWALAVALGVMWSLSAFWIWLVSRPQVSFKGRPLAAPDVAYLHGVARDTWRYFERCVVSSEQDLPPDNLQTSPEDIVAHRTSPTNIGLYLLSAACARQFGWIGTQDLLDRLESTVTRLGSLQRFRGHFINWYDTQTGQALSPRYVSTVDSGNLCGHLLAVAQACRELSANPFAVDCSAKALQASKSRLATLLAKRAQLSQLEREDLLSLLSDYRTTKRSAWRDAMSLREGLEPTSAARLQALATICEQIAHEADFRFLYHPTRHLFHIGLRVDELQLDAGFYDLLASESRLTGLWAIAKGDVPVAHWGALGRPFYTLGSDVGLRSWSGSMFEYLMPSLMLEEPAGGVLHSACLLAVKEQMNFCVAKGLPWGISESAHAQQDHTLAYQYGPHGVPRLALRRVPIDEMVMAPYATVLALQVCPQQAVSNLWSMEALGSRGRYGFLEALDYSPSAQSAGGSMTLVHTFMAHHQGMSIVALANVLLDGVARRWGMANEYIQAVDSLLHERTPREVSNLFVPPQHPLAASGPMPSPGLNRSVVPGEQSIEPTHLLSNGHYQVTLRSNGAGWSRWGGLDLNRWRDDVLRDAYGCFVFIRKSADDAPLSLTRHPAPDPDAAYRAHFHADRVIFEANWSHLQAHTTVWVSPEDDVEFRQVELHNQGDEPLALDLLCAFEVALNFGAADEAHPAFANLFVRAHWLAAQSTLLFERRPRLPEDLPVFAAHFVSVADADVQSIDYQTDRLLWTGRNRHVSQPAAMFTAAEQDGTDTGLDPMSALRVRVCLAPHATATVTFGIAASRDKLILKAIVDKYQQVGNVQRASLMSATLTSIRLQGLRISAEHFAAIQSITTALLYTLAKPSPRAHLAHGAGVCDRRTLWRFGMSGERPIVLVSASLMHGLTLLRNLGQAMRIWAWGGVLCDLVVVDGEASSYYMALHQELLSLRDRYLADMGAASGLAQSASSGYHVLLRSDLSDDEYQTLEGLARIHLRADGRLFQQHLIEWMQWHDMAKHDRDQNGGHTVATVGADRCPPLRSTGRFSQDGALFCFPVGARRRPARPWVNVVSNPGFGLILSESGGGYTWARNSRLMQVTTWSNDPVSDPLSQVFLIQDVLTRQTWCITPSAWAHPQALYRVSHGQGVTIITHQAGDLDVSATWTVDAETSVQQVQIELGNRGQTELKLRVIGITEWQMGARKADRAVLSTEVQRHARHLKKCLGLFCTQLDQALGFGQATAFFSLAIPAHQVEDWTCDRREFVDVDGNLVVPNKMGRQAGQGLDPCAALSTTLDLAPGQTVETCFLTGYSDTPHQASELWVGEMAIHPQLRLQQALSKWTSLLTATTVKTPDARFDALVNRWLIYQTVSCRLWSKAGFYQAGGATGFRDQLQDTLALSWAAPQMLREQIIKCAGRQFPQGDVQHWWHTPGGAGVRTHFSDDLLWLPYAVSHYLQTVGDEGVLDHEVPFIDGQAIPDGAEDAYYTPQVSGEWANVYEHAARAIDHSLNVGVHGLPLMGTGDWNDGMNRVGHGGQGESVWLGWFLWRILQDFVPLARDRGQADRVHHWESCADQLKHHLNESAWDGLWFKRAYFDDGQPLGSYINAEGKIDLIAQAWSVLSGAGLPALQVLAMSSVEAQLVDQHAGLIKLLSPPLSEARPSAGYIQAYPAGVRENGGQYSHAGVWALMALAELVQSDWGQAAGRVDAVYRYFTYLSPAHRAGHAGYGSAYGIEPYVMAGDVYTQEPYVGRGGWSWYTGSASWMHQAAVTSIFGLEQGVTELLFRPCLPAHWHQAEITLKRGEKSMRFILARPNRVAMLRQTEAQWVANGAPVVVPGQALNWVELPVQATVVIALAEA